MAKRLFDIVFSATVLLLGIPVLPLIALGVKLDSKGPVFFKQLRVGLNGKPFTILKFRTMRQLPGSSITVAGDSRITNFGLFLRRYKLDEMPQFVNVLIGNMSIVGPRPEVPRYVALYPSALRERILSVRPGITDLASIAFKNESDLLSTSENPERTYIDEILPVKLQHYLFYVDNRTFWLDMRIVGLTVRAIFS